MLLMRVSKTDCSWIIRLDLWTSQTPYNNSFLKELFNKYLLNEPLTHKIIFLVYQTDGHVHSNESLFCWTTTDLYPIILDWLIDSEWCSGRMHHQISWWICSRLSFIRLVFSFDSLCLCLSDRNLRWRCVSAQNDDQTLCGFSQTMFWPQQLHLPLHLLFQI